MSAWGRLLAWLRRLLRLPEPAPAPEPEPEPLPPTPDDPRTVMFGESVVQHGGEDVVYGET